MDFFQLRVRGIHDFILVLCRYQDDIVTEGGEAGKNTLEETFLSNKLRSLALAQTSTPASSKNDRRNS